MKLTGAYVARSASVAERIDLRIGRGHILPFESTASQGAELDVSDCLLLPGLINSHDHLEFNLFPRLGSGPHANYVNWADSIFHPDREPVRTHLRVPKQVRLYWGGIKNLLNGVTTVSHHNPYESPVFLRGFPVRVLRRFGWAHSVHFAPDFNTRYRNTPRELPFLMHAGEGNDDLARAEIPLLCRAGILSERTVLIHAVSLDKQGLELMRQTGAGVVWCPTSNMHTIGETLGDHVLRSGLPIALGTDSALTAQGDLIDELCAAKRLGGFAADELYEMVTTISSRLLRLQNGEGEIREGGVADLVAVSNHGCSPAQALENLRPQLVIVGGRIKLVSAAFAERLPGNLTARLGRIHVESRGEYLVDAPIAGLISTTRYILGNEFKLAGRKVAA